MKLTLFTFRFLFGPISLLCVLILSELILVEVRSIVCAWGLISEARRLMGVVRLLVVSTIHIILLWQMILLHFQI